MALTIFPSSIRSTHTIQLQIHTKTRIHSLALSSSTAHTLCYTCKKSVRSESASPLCFFCRVHAIGLVLNNALVAPPPGVPAPSLLPYPCTSVDTDRISPKLLDRLPSRAATLSSRRSGTRSIIVPPPPAGDANAPALFPEPAADCAYAAAVAVPASDPAGFTEDWP